jgi:hypothetical protein
MPDKSEPIRAIEIANGRVPPESPMWHDRAVCMAGGVPPEVNALIGQEVPLALAPSGPVAQPAAAPAAPAPPPPAAQPTAEPPKAP